jgi:hypothetical protein
MLDLAIEGPRPARADDPHGGRGGMYATDFYRAVGFVEADRVATELGTGLRMYLDLTPTGRRDRHGRESGGG